jgi:hypothetical protein
MIARQENSVVDEWVRVLANVGIREASLLSERYGPDHFGDGEARFRWGSIVVRLVRERGEDFVELESIYSPDQSFRWEDVSIAFGWCTVDEVVARGYPVPTSDVLAEIVRREPALHTALDAEHFGSTREAVASAAAKRENAFLGKLQRLADE